MGQIKMYTIVTNDEYELPVAIDIKGAKSVADYLGISIQSLRHRIMRDRWSGKYKAVVSGVVPEVDRKQYMKRYVRKDKTA